MVEITGRSTINTVLKDPTCSKWLKDALISALDCDPADVERDAWKLVLLLRRYAPIGRFPPSKKWPGKPPREIGPMLPPLLP
jgi:hypothetical protein